MWTILDNDPKNWIDFNWHKFTSAEKNKQKKLTNFKISINIKFTRLVWGPKFLETECQNKKRWTLFNTLMLQWKHFCVETNSLRKCLQISQIVTKMASNTD